MNRRAMFPIGIALAVFVLIFGAVTVYLLQANQKTDVIKQNSEATSEIKNFDGLSVKDAPLPVTTKVVGGDLKVTGNVTIVDGLTSSSLQLMPVQGQAVTRAGQLYTTTDNELYYNNGTSSTNLSGGLNRTQNEVARLRIDTQRLLSQPDGVVSIQGQVGQVVLAGTDGITISGTTISNNGVLTVQGRAGNVQFVGGAGIGLNGTTIMNTGVTSFGGQAGSISIGNGLGMSNGELVNTGITQLVSGSADITVSANGNGSFTIGYTGSGVGGTIALAPNQSQIDASNNASIAINKTGLGNLIQLSTGTSSANKFVVDQSGAIINGSINFTQVTGIPSLVNSIGGLNGTVTLGSGLAVNGGQLVATTAVQSLVGTANQINVSGTNGVFRLSLPQDISVNSTPTFAGLTLTNALSVENGGTGAQNAAAARNNLEAATRGANSDITSLSGLTTSLSVAQGGTGRATLSANSVLIGNGSSAISSLTPSAVNQCLVSNGSGVLAFENCPGSGGVSTLNGKSGTVTITAVDPTSIDSTGTAIVIRDASTTVKGLASFNSTNFSVLNGRVNTIQNIGTGAAPTFAGLNLSSALGVASGGTGRTSFSANSILVGQGTGALATVSSLTANQCLVTGSGGTLSFADCPGTGGVSSLNGMSGVVTLSTLSASSLSQSGSTITIRDASDTVNGLASFDAEDFIVTNGRVSTIQDISVTATPTFAGINLSAPLSVSNGGTGRNSLAANSIIIGNGSGAVTTLGASAAGQCLASGAGGVLAFVSCPGAVVVNTLNNADGNVTITAVDPASITTTGSTITVRDASSSVKGLASFNGSNFSVSNGAVNTIQDIGTTATPVFDGISLSRALGVSSGGTGASSFATNSLLVGQGTAAIGTISTTTAGQCLQSGSGGSLSFSTCPGSNGVTSINGLVGSVQVGASSSSSILTTGSTITIRDASDVIKGLASFNAANLVVTNGVVNTIQDIATTAAPSFASISLATALPVSSGGTGATSFTNDGVVIGSGGNALRTVNATASSQCLISGAGNTLSFQACPGSGGVSSLNGASGALTLSATDPTSINTVGTTITIRDSTVARKGLASFSADNFTVTNGAVNTIQDIGTGATPTFAGLNLGSALSVANGGTGATTAVGARTNLGAAARGANTDITSLGSVDSITSAAGLSISANGGTLRLQGTATVLAQTNGVFSTQLDFATPSANVTYRLQAAAAGTYDVCTTAGNCVGVGGGVSTLGGTTGKLSRFVSGSAIGDSIITDDGSTVSIAGTLNVNTINPSAALLIGSLTQSLSLQGSNTSISSTGSATTNTLSFVTPSGSNKTINIPNASGTVAVSATGPLQIDANGNISCPSCLTGGSGGGGATGVSTVNGITGDVTITGSDVNAITMAGSTITINDATATRKGLASFNSQNLVVSNGVVNTIQNIGTGATPTFAGLNLSAPLSVSSGGTGRNTLAKGLLIGNGTNGVDILAPTGASECLASDSSSNLVFVACPGTSVVNYINGLNGTVTLDTVSASSLSTVGNTIRIQDATSSIKGLAAFNSQNLTVTNGVVNTVQNISTSAAPSFDGLTLANALGVASGGTGATTGAGARANLGAAAAGANSDITALTGLTTALSVSQGGTGQSSLTANRVLLGNGSNGIAVTNAATAGLCLVGNSSGAPSFQACTGSGGVSSLNGLNGTVTLDTVSASSLSTVGNTIRIQDATSSIKGLAAFDSSNFTVTNGVVNTAQNITTGATPTFAGLNLSTALSVANGGTGRSSLAVNGVVIGQGTGAVSTISTSTANQCLVSGTGGVLMFASCPGAGGVSSVNGLAGAVTIDTVSASSILTSGSTIRIQDATTAIKGLASFSSDNFVVTSGSVNTAQNISTSATPTFAGLNLSAPLTVASGGTGRSTLAANSVLVGNGSSAVSLVGTSNTNQCLVSGTGGTLSFQACPGAGGVSSVNGRTGALTVTAADPASISTAGSVITILDATDSIKGLASFNGGNFTVTNGAVNTIQNIDTTATPTFGGLTLGSALGVSNGGTGAASFATNGVVIGQGTGALTTVATTTANQCLISGTGGVLMFASCPGAGGVSSLNGLNGAISLSTTTSSSLLTSGNTITIADATATVKGLASFNSANLTVTNGAVNTIQNISVSATPTFAGLSLTSALGVTSGGTGQSSLTANRVLLGNGTTGIAVSNVPTSGYCLIGNGGSSAPTFQACPIGGNISSGTAQTSGVVAMFDVTQNQITNSRISQSGAVVAVDGQLTATSYVGDGSALTNLSASSISTGTLNNARLSGVVTLQGNSFNGSSQLLRLDTSGQATTNGLCLLSTGTGAGTAFGVCPGSNIVEGANRALSNLSNVAINDMLLPSASNTIDFGSASLTFRNAYFGGNISAAGTVNGLTLTSSTIQSSGALNISAGGTNQAVSIAGSGSGGVRIDRGTGNLTLTGFSCNTSANGGKLTTNASGVVNCADDVAGASVVGTMDSQTASANGAVISGNTLYLQTASTSTAGLVSTSSQTFAGTKQFNGQLIANGTTLLQSTTTISGATTISGSLQVGTAAMGVLYTDASGVVQKVATAGVTVGNCLAYTGTNTLGFQSCGNGGGGAASFVQGGNAFNATGVLGTTDAQAMNIIQGNTTRIALAQDGNITLNPDATKFLFVNSSASDSDAKLIVGGRIKTDTGFKVGTLNGTSVTSCAGYVQNMVISGGIVTAGSCSTGGSVGQAIVQGGNAFGSTMTIGTTDAQAINFIQGNATRVAYSQDGNIDFTTGTNKWVRVNSSDTDSEAKLIVTGRIKSDTGFKVGSTNGVSIANCTTTLTNITVNGGIVTQGSCSSAGGGQPFVQGGNSVSGDTALGLTSNNTLNILQNNATRISLGNDGNIRFNPDTNKAVLINGASVSGDSKLIVAGRIRSDVGYNVNGRDGITLTCSGTIDSPQFSGGILVQSGCKANNSDLAENYSSSDNLQPGDIVMASGKAPTDVTYAKSNQREKIMGVVSTAPGKVLGTEQVKDGYPIALVGRVPVKVNGEGGAIGIGDKITISSMTGVGKKATSAGMIVGSAVESFNGVGNGTIEVFVYMSYWSPVDGNNLQAESGAFGSLNISGHTTLNTLSVSGEARFNANIVVNGHIITGGGAPNYSVASAAGAGAAVRVEGNDTAGTVTITVGAGSSAGNLANLSFAKGYGKAPRIILSGQDDASLSARIFPSGKTSGGFALSTAQTLSPGTYTFDYFIVE